MNNTRQNCLLQQSCSSEIGKQLPEKNAFTWLRNIVDELDDIKHVVNFQKACGLQKVDPSNVVAATEKQASGTSNIKKCCSSNVCYRVNKPRLYRYFQLSRHGGEEILFLLFFPFVMWCVDTWVLRRVSFTFAFCMFLCTAAKDILCKERPSCPPLFRLESRSTDEFSFPSTHAVAISSTLLPLLIASYSRYLVYWPTWAVVVVCVFVVLAIASVCLSRIYNGMHTFFDVLCGLICSVVLVASPITKVDQLFEPFFLHNHMSPLVVTLIGFLISALYPKVENWNTGRGDSIILVGMHCGYVIGCWFNQSVLEQPPDVIPVAVTAAASSPSTAVSYSTLILYPFLRMVVGLPLVFVLRLIVRSTVLTTICFVLNKNKNDANTKQIPNVELCFKYFSYLIMGFFGVAFLPFVFKFININ